MTSAGGEGAGPSREPQAGPSRPGPGTDNDDGAGKTDSTAFSVASRFILYFC
jgi:hypothetical protein